MLGSFGAAGQEVMPVQRSVLGEIKNIFETQRTQSAQRTATAEVAALWFPLRASASSAFQSCFNAGPRKAILAPHLPAPQPKRNNRRSRLVSMGQEQLGETQLRNDASEPHTE